MKRSLVIAFCVLTCAATVFAQGYPGSIDIFSDLDAWSDCAFYDVQEGYVSMYVVHIYELNVRSSQFKLAVPSCNEMTHLSTNIHLPYSIGDIFTGISIAYPSCLGGVPILLATVNWWTHGLTPECCYFSIVPDPSAQSGRIEVSDCDLNLMYAWGGQAIVNPTYERCWCYVPYEETTWGQVKALYR